MSHPDPTRTYDDDILGQWNDDELQLLWELYVENCSQKNVKPSLSDFPVWLEERYL